MMKDFITATSFDVKPYDWREAFKQPAPTTAMTPDEMMRELERRQRQAKAHKLAKKVIDLNRQAERDKRLIHEQLSEDAVFSLTYVPFVIAEVAWDYIDSILNIAVLMRLRETKPLCRTMKELRKEYDRERFAIINDKWRASETENMIMFQEELAQTYFSPVLKQYREAIEAEHGKIDDNSLMLVLSAYMCDTVLEALQRYERAQSKIVRAIIGYDITIRPKQLDTVKRLVLQFCGDVCIPDAVYREMRDKNADELAKCMVEDISMNDTDKEQEEQKTSKTTKQPKVSQSKHKMTMEELKELVGKIQASIADFNKNAEKNLNGNKKAGVRARKASLELEKLMKEYRKNSVQ